MHGLDRIDRKIVAELMRDATLPVARIAERVGLSQTPCWKRINRLKSEGIITAQVALVDPARIGCGLTVFVNVSAPEHGPEWQERFNRLVAELPEVMEVFRMAGEADYLLRLAVPDMAGYDRIYKRLTAELTLRGVTAHFAMERVKATTAYPLDTTSH